MASLTLTLPSGEVRTDQLRDELAAALGISAPYVDFYPDRVEVVGEVDGTMTAAAQAALDAHVPEPPAPSIPDRLAAVEARLDRAAAAEVAGDAAKLRDGLRSTA